MLEVDDSGTVDDAAHLLASTALSNRAASIV
jgi:hypothetical protein